MTSVCMLVAADSCLLSITSRDLRWASHLPHLLFPGESSNSHMLCLIVLPVMDSSTFATTSVPAGITDCKCMTLILSEAYTSIPWAFMKTPFLFAMTGLKVSSGLPIHKGALCRAVITLITLDTVLRVVDKVISLSRGIYMY